MYFVVVVVVVKLFVNTDSEVKIIGVISSTQLGVATWFSIAILKGKFLTQWGGMKRGLGGKGAREIK